MDAVLHALQECRRENGTDRGAHGIQQPGGMQTHVRVKLDTKSGSRVKVGDSIAAQLTSSGHAEAVLNLGARQACSV